MSEPSISLEEELLSPDMFSDTSTVKNSTCDTDEEAASSASIGISEPEPTNDIPEWKGVSMDEIHKGLDAFAYQEHPTVCPSAHHTVLILLPYSGHGLPKPYPIHRVDKWCDGFVRMPHSIHSLYPTNEETGSKHCRNRWEMIQEILLQNYISSHQLEAAILSYNKTYAKRWNFTALHYFFSEVVDENETEMFFKTLLPKMVQLALQLPVLITGPLPLLKRHTNASITLSQLQIASLLANAFFCTFPRRNSNNPQSEYASYPHINFNRLFSALRADKRNRCNSLMEKLKCIFHYFRRVTSKAPEGIITIERRYIPRSDCPKWDAQSHKLSPLHITSRGTIETEGAGLLQVDFANKYIGGGVLGLGCVQEEIRFITCPELMVTMLITEVLDDTEALVISGIERYCKYEGYSNTFKWTGDFVDETPRDSSGRRMTSIVAIDALFFKQPTTQFEKNSIARELNKAYVGFVGCEELRGNLPAIATGNWGCGAYHGNPKLKVLLQLMAAAVAGRSVVYFTFGDANLRDEVAEMYWHLVRHNIDIGHLFSILCQYKECGRNRRLDFYQFLYNRCKMKSSLEIYFKPEKNVEARIPLAKNSSDFDFSNVRHTREDTPYLNPREREAANENNIQNWIDSISESVGTDAIGLNADSDNNCNPEKQIDNDKGNKGEAKDNKCQEVETAAEKTREQLLKMIFNDEMPKGDSRRKSTLDLLSKAADNNNLGTSRTEVRPKTANVKPNIVINNSDTTGKNLLRTDKLISPAKRPVQKRISDFFPRK